MSKKRLDTASMVLAYQKDWFHNVSAAARGGEPLALLNADAPHEVFRAFGIPYVVNQWWASIISAKRQGPTALSKLTERGLPDTSQQYDTIPLGEQFLSPADRPWGGLPQPTYVAAERSGDITQKIFEQWSRFEGTEKFLLSRTGANAVVPKWWEKIDSDWESVFGADRIDLLAAEIQGLADTLSERTGRPLDLDRLREIMGLANEQARWNRKTRDLIANARPCPVEINDVIPAVMVPQWHRGTQWAVDAARSLHDEIRERIDSRHVAAPRERRRLMWVGRGLWSNLDLFHQVAEDHGAIFVWSMYLSIAADGYIREGDDPIRTLAARFVGLTDLLYVPPYSSEWYVKEAVTHGVDGVVHLVADDTPGGSFISRELERAGFPVLEIRANNADSRSSEAARIPEQISEFIAHRVPESNPHGRDQGVP